MSGQGNGYLDRYIIQDPGAGLGAKTKNVLALVTSSVAYSPAILDGESVRVKKEMEVKFRLE